MQTIARFFFSFLFLTCIFGAKVQAQLFSQGASGMNTWNACGYDLQGYRYLGGMQRYYVGNSFVLQKQDPVGNPLWTKVDGGIAGTMSNGSKIVDLLIAPNGDVFVLASIGSGASLNGSIITTNGTDDYFLLKYSNSGTFLWSQQINTASSWSIMHGLDALSNGNIVVGGYFDATMIVGGATYTPNGKTPCKIVFNAATGSPTVSTLGSNTSLTAFAVDASDNFIFTGYVSGQGIIIRKISPANTTLWTASGTAYGQFVSMDTDPAGNVYATGFFNSSQWAFGGVGLTCTSAYDDVMACKVDASGALVWHKGYGGFGADQSKNIRCDAAGNVYVGGFFEGGSANFPPLASTGFGSYDIFVAQLSTTNGDALWVNHGGNSNADIFLDMSIHPISQSPTFVGVSTFFSGAVNFGSLAFSDTSHVGYWVDILPNACKSAGNVFRDQDASGSQTAGDLPFANVIVQASPTNFSALSGLSGEYGIYTNTGNYSINIPYPPLYHTATTAASLNSNFTALGQANAGLNFGFAPVPNMNDLRVTLVPTNYGARVAMIEGYNLTYENIGTTTQNNVVLTFKMPQGVSYFSATPMPASASINDSVTWNIGTLVPGQVGFVQVYANIAMMGIGLPLDFQGKIAPIAGDQTPNDNISAVTQLTANSWDPNDKRVSHEVITPNAVAAGQWLTYTVRFQNTGNAPAFNIYIADTLSDKLDIASLQILAVSHNYSLRITGAGNLRFDFPNINLPDSGSNEIGSHGFVTYRVRVKNSLSLGDKVYNTAFIYFDFNPPIITNTTTTLVAETTGITPAANAEWVRIFPNPAQHSVVLRNAGQQAFSFSLWNMTGQKVLETQGEGAEQRVSLEGLPAGVYGYLFRDAAGNTQTGSLVKE